MCREIKKIRGRLNWELKSEAITGQMTLNSKQNSNMFKEINPFSIITVDWVVFSKFK